MTNENNVKREGLDAKAKVERSRKIAIALGVIVAGIYGYRLGAAINNYYGEKGLKHLFEKDPTLKEHMAGVMADEFKQRLLKS